MEATSAAATTPAGGLEPAFAEQWLERFLEAWNKPDGDVLAAISTDDVLWSDPVLPEPERGRDGMRRFVAETAQAFPDFHVAQRAPLVVSTFEPVVLFRWRMTGTMHGPWSYSNLAPSGRRFEIIGVDEWTFRDGLMSHCRSNYDRLDMARQLGIVPPLGSTGDRIMTRIQHIKARRQRRNA
jgi:steroid delta-isomerase-like uncharacterized protein